MISFWDIKICYKEKRASFFNYNYLCELRWFFAELVKVCHLDDDNACGWVSMVLMMQRRISVKGRAQLILEHSDKDKKFMMCCTHLKRQKIWKMNHNCEIFSSLQILNSIDAKRFSENSWFKPTQSQILKVQVQLIFNTGTESPILS